MLESIQYLDDEIARINETIAQLVVRRCALQARRNEHTFINRCPNEILLGIFRDAHLSELDTIFCAYPETLVTVTRVCSRWRNLAYSNSFLWATIDLVYDVGTARRMLELSERSGLTLRGEHRYEEDLEKSTATLRHIRQTTPETVRILQLELSDFGSVNISSPVMGVLMPVPFTHLESLNLSCAVGAPMSFPKPDPYLFMFPLGMAHLRILVLSGIHTSYFAPLRLVALTFLELSSFPLPNDILQFLKQLAEGCPSLQHLALRDVYNLEDGGPISGLDGQAYFPVLQSAVFSGSTPALLNALLARLSVNTSSCNVELTLGDDASTPYTPLTAVREYTSRQRWSIERLSFRITSEAVGIYIYPPRSGEEQDGAHMVLRIMRGYRPESWEGLQTKCRFLWDTFPREKLEIVYTEFCERWDGSSMLDGPRMDREAGEQWPVEDVFATLFESVPMSLQSLVTDL